jgi:hypothetical protein
MTYYHNNFKVAIRTKQTNLDHSESKRVRVPDRGGDSQKVVGEGMTSHDSMFIESRDDIARILPGNGSDSKVESTSESEPFAASVRGYYRRLN